MKKEDLELLYECFKELVYDYDNLTLKYGTVKFKECNCFYCSEKDYHWDGYFGYFEYDIRDINDFVKITFVKSPDLTLDIAIQDIIWEDLLNYKQKPSISSMYIELEDYFDLITLVSKIKIELKELFLKKVAYREKMILLDALNFDVDKKNENKRKKL